MTEDKTITDNEVLARFENLPPQYEDGTPGFVHEDEDGLTWGYAPEELQYHKKWSWLMPVVEKLNKLLDEGHLEGLDLDLFRSMQDWITSVNIKYAYTDAVAIIRWYNSTQNKEQS